MSAQLPKNCNIATGKFCCEETRDEGSSPWLLYPSNSLLSSNLNRSFKDKLLFLKQLTTFGLFLLILLGFCYFLKIMCTGNFMIGEVGTYVLGLDCTQSFLALHFLRN